MSQARLLRARLEVLPDEVERAKNGTDDVTSAEVLALADRMRTAREALATTEGVLEAEKGKLWAGLMKLRRKQAVEWEKTANPNRQQQLQPEVVLAIIALGFGGVVGGLSGLGQHPIALAVTVGASVVSAGWWGWLRGRTSRAIEEAERVL
jgi:hypothetical protein